MTQTGCRLNCTSKAVNKDFFRLEKIFIRREILYVDDEYRNNHTRNDRYLPKTGSRAFNTFLENLKKSQKADPEADFVLEGTVQNFNLAFDIWNSRIKALRSKKKLLQKSIMRDMIT